MKHRDNLIAPPATVCRPPAQTAAWLVRHAAHRTPLSLRPRLEEEWLADLSAQSGALSQLRFALGCCWATQVIAHDPMAFGVTARGAVAGHGAIAAFAPGHAPPGFSRSTVVVLVLALHVAVIFAFMTGVIPPIGQTPSKPFETIFFPPTKSPPLPPPGPTPQFRHWTTVPPEVPYPNVPSWTAETTDHVDPPHPASQIASAVRVSGGLGAGFPNADEFYPVASKRLEETGAAAVRVCVDDRGRLAGEPTIADSTGFARLDAGALALAKAGSGHYRSATEDGRPVASCFAFRVRFSLRS